ncbi:MAG: SDR family NAD(P)-dependent oxidoreductase [Caulobacteraceae bacterium]
MSDPLFDITGKIALVTGGTSGIGRMIAQGLVARGVKTYVAGRDPARAKATAAEIASASGTCIGLAADLADAAGPKRLAEALGALETRLDLLVNNAGANATGSLAEMTVDDWDLVLGVNLRSAFFLSRELLPLLKAAASPRDPARIVCIGSIGGLHVPNWEAHAYGASKAGLHHLTRSLAKALGKEHITANAIAPGPFPSRLTDTDSEQGEEERCDLHPSGAAGVRRTTSSGW